MKDANAQMLSEEAAQIRRYLLGELPEAELLQVEDRLMTEDGFYDKIAIVEEELIEDYLRDALPADDRRQFETSFLSLPAARDHLAFSKELRELALRKAPSVIWQAEKTDRASFQPNRLHTFLTRHLQPVTYAVIVSMLALIVTGSWLAYRLWQLQRQVNQVRGEQAASQDSTDALLLRIAELQAANEKMAQEMEAERQHSASIEQQLMALSQERNETRSTTADAHASLAALLFPGQLRGRKEMKKLSLSSTVSRVQFSLVVTAGRSGQYRATLNDAEGKPVWSQDGLRLTGAANQRVLQVIIPASSLPPGAYEFVVSGGDDDYTASYYFTVSAR